MALKAKLEKVEGLPADVAKEYKKVNEGGKEVYVLDVEGAYLADEPIEQVREKLTTAKNHEKEARQRVEAELKEFKTTRDTLEKELNDLRKGAIPKADAEALEKSYKEQLARREKELLGEIQGLNKSIESFAIDAKVTEIANAISDSPDLLIPHIRGRLKLEKGADGTFTTRILDREGKPTALGISELQKEVSEDPKFKPIIRGSKASGGGASGGKSGSGASGDYDPTKFNPGKATPQEWARHLKWKKEQEQKK